MKMKMELGAEPKKVAILAGLLVVAAYLMYTNVFSGGSMPPQQAYTPPPAPVRPNPLTSIRSAEQAAAAVSASAGPARNARQASAAVEFRPSLKPKRPEDQPDMSRVDPALRLDVLAKLQQVRLDGAGRSLFDFGAAPPPKLPEPKIIPGKGKGKGKGPEELKPPVLQAEDIKPVEPPKPPPPPIPLKFYGFISGRAGGEKRAFFLQGEDIFVAGEGETIKARFKVLRIGINSAMVEDVQHNHQQSLPLELVPNV